MDIEKAFELAYHEMEVSPYVNFTGFKKIIGLFLLIHHKNYNSNPLIHIEKDIEKSGVVYFNQSTKQSTKVDCSPAPEYEKKEALGLWVKAELSKVEVELGAEIFISIPKNPIQGKTY